jgi:hypothetical protein
MVSISMLVNASPRLYELWDVERTLKILGEIGKMVTGPVGCLGPGSSSEGSALGEILLSPWSLGVCQCHMLDGRYQVASCPMPSWLSFGNPIF